MVMKLAKQYRSQENEEIASMSPASIVLTAISSVLGLVKKALQRPSIAIKK
jgi:hypothetical protein